MNVVSAIISEKADIKSLSLDALYTVGVKLELSFEFVIFMSAK